MQQPPAYGLPDEPPAPADPPAPPEAAAPPPPAPPGPPRVWTVLVAFFGAFVAVLALNAVLLGALVGVITWRRAKSGESLDAEMLMKSLLTDHAPVLLIASGLISVVCLSGASLGGAWLSKEPFAERLSMRRVGIAPLLLGGLGPVPIAWATGAALKLAGLEDKSDSLKMIGESIKNASPPVFAVLALIVGLVGPLGEELMFRGYMQTRLLRRFPPAIAVGIASVAFAAMHLDPVHVLGVLPIGVALGVASWRTNSLWPAVLAHVVNNSVATAAGRWAEGEPGSSGVVAQALGFAALGGAMMAGLVWITRGKVIDFSAADTRGSAPRPTL